MIDASSLKVGITIGSVLDDFGIRYRGRRCACPVHKGDNSSAFSFTETGFWCHTRGCHGDVIDLIRALSNTDHRGALEYLARRKGFQLPPYRGKRSAGESRTVALATSEMLKKDSKANALRTSQRTVKSFQNRWTRELRELRDKLRFGLISECDYYTEALIADEHLEALGAKEAALNWKLKRT